MQKEKKLVTLSLVILFVSLLVVYLLFYQVKGRALFTQVQSTLYTDHIREKQENTTVVQDIMLPSSDNELYNDWIEETHLLEWELFSDITSWDDAHQEDARWNQNASTETHLNIEDENIHLLTGTDLYFGAVESIEILGLEPEYLLKDKKGFYYAKLPKEPELKTTVQDLWGNIYTISTEAELIKNKLFGDKISFINLPEYKNKLVIMILKHADQYRLIQMDYDRYHHAKSYLKTLFTQ